MPANCMICDLYKIIDQNLTDYPDSEEVRDVIAELVTVLPPRGHGMHDLARWQEAYTTPPIIMAW